MTLDHINAVFEGGSALFIASNVRRLYVDKKLSGVNVATTAWFSIWGFWNLFYYFGLAQWFSWAMGAFVFLANTTWVILALRYRSNDRAAAHWSQARLDEMIKAERETFEEKQARWFKDSTK